ncbi:MAG: aldo/keto reductase [Victivallaceae bacterium]|nr:aldo/keto reductase [Victivallaceae bacterium]
MQKRMLGNTEMELSLIGFGGFHLVETPQSQVNELLNKYLDRGGNYIETAAQYGNTMSESKIGRAVSSRRDEFFLATKCLERTRDKAAESIDHSLKNLNTDHLDIIFMHGVQSIDISETILAPGGAMEAALEAQRQGKVKYIGLTGHGQPTGLIHAIKNYPYDVLMTGINYYDRFNFPDVETILLPECQKRGISLLGMKAIGDGYLYRSVKTAIRYTLSQPISSLVLGINRNEYLEEDLAIVDKFEPMSQSEQEKLFSDALELGRYVCRQCGKCSNVAEFDPAEIFLLEGLYDRQMVDGYISDPAHYALTERLKHWFGHKDQALAKYRKSSVKINPEKDYRHLNSYCPYGIDIDRKLKLVHHKLCDDDFIF